MYKDFILSTWYDAKFMGCNSQIALVGVDNIMPSFLYNMQSQVMSANQYNLELWWTYWIFP